MSAPSVSVVIPAHNALRYLPEALDSVRAQAYPGLEVLLVDDASTDGSAAWAARQPLPGLRLLRFRRNRGAGAARKLAVSKARGELVAFLDADDAWKPGYLRAMTPLFRDPGVALAFANVDLVDEDGRVLRRRGMRFGGRHVCTPTVSTTVVRREAIRRAGGIDAGFKRLFDDSDLFSRVVLRYGTGALRWVDRSLGLRRMHGSQLTEVLKPAPARRDESQMQVLLDLIRLGRKHERWLAPMMPAGKRFPADTLSWGGWSVFVLAYRRAREREKAGLGRATGIWTAP